jgi:glycosyltransferase involved in cell wall biosynthesis
MSDRIRELEAEVERLRRRLATKEREVAEIYRSRAWRAVSLLRSLLTRLRIRLPVFAGPPGSQPGAPSDSIAPANPGKYDVICFAIHDWDFRFQRAQQLMSRFAAHGHRVFYIAPNTSGCAVKVPNVYEVGDVSNIAIDDAVVIVQLPSFWPRAKQLGWKVVYDCMDLHAGFTTTSREVLANEESLLREADLVVATSDVLAKRAQRDDVLLLRNACDFEHFARTPKAHNARPVIGYYGAIAEWFDTDLVVALAKKRPDWDFLLVGSLYGAKMGQLASLPNVALPGEQAYESLPEWLGRFDVAVIPFRRTPLTEATNPVKVYEMLAGGKPVVSVPIPEVAALAPLVRLASNADEFERAIEAAMLDHDAETRREFARQHTWEARFNTLAAAISLARARQ